MRTTLDLDDALYARAKDRALRAGKTLTAVVEDALRIALEPAPPNPEAPIKLTVVTGGGLLPGIDLVDYSELIERVEGPLAGP